MMGGFFESHTEDVTSVKFHPTNPDLMATGSTDGRRDDALFLKNTFYNLFVLGLINIFDISQESEDDALKYCLNSESSVGKLKWHPNETLSCITNTNCLQIWDVDAQDLLKDWSREAITETIQRKSVIDCNLIDCHDFDGKMVALATSNYNKGENKFPRFFRIFIKIIEIPGECVRTLKCSSKKLKPSANFLGNSQILRASLYQEGDDIFYTFGEGGVISVWKEGESPAEPEKTSLKEDSNIKKKLKNKSKPY